MKRKFVESSIFSKALKSLRYGDQLLREIQSSIIDDPKAGSVIQNTGGFRKLRVGDGVNKRGKSGSYRIIYLDRPLSEITHLMILLSKNEKENITDEEKKTLRSLSKHLK